MTLEMSLPWCVDTLDWAVCPDGSTPRACTGAAAAAAAAAADNDPVAVDGLVDEEDDEGRSLVAWLVARWSASRSPAVSSNMSSRL